MAEAALVLGAFIAGIAFREFWPRLVDKSEKAHVHPATSKEYFDKLAAPADAYSSIEEFEKAINPGVVASKPIDKRRRGVAEMRHIAEQKSLEPVIHQAEVTAKNARAMDS
jgi:hypothetical protein